MVAVRLGRKNLVPYSQILFASPSAVAGIARTLDLFALLDDYNYSASPDEADALALYNDWKAVGSDLLATAKPRE